MKNINDAIDRRNYNDEESENIVSMRYVIKVIFEVIYVYVIIVHYRTPRNGRLNKIRVLS